MDSMIGFRQMRVGCVPILIKPLGRAYLLYAKMLVWAVHVQTAVNFYCHCDS